MLDLDMVDTGMGVLVMVALMDMDPGIWHRLLFSEVVAVTIVVVASAEAGMEEGDFKNNFTGYYFFGYQTLGNYSGE